MKILFSKENTLLSKTIRLITWSDWSHVEFITPEGTLLGAEAGKGVYEVFISERTKSASEMMYIEVPLDREDTEALISWARSQKGKPYDYVGLFSFLFKRDLSEREKYWCSEFVATAFEVINKPLVRPGALYKISPQTLWSLPYEAKKLT